MGRRYALAGNPNCGKTTLFNAVTGSNQYVGNWPGVTVEKKEGRIAYGDMDASIVDLPGIYSLSPYSMEEIVTRNYLLNENPDMIINIADATNLERNLYLSLQLAELGKPMVIALNMIDLVEKSGDSIDTQMLSALLGIQIVPISAAKGTGIHKLLCAAHQGAMCEGSACAPPDIYTGPARRAILRIEELIAADCAKKALPLRWTAVKLIEGDAPTLKSLGLDDAKLSRIESIAAALETNHIDREMVIADQKYKFICSVTEKCVSRAHEAGDITLSDQIDRVVTNKYLAIPLFFGLMLLIFYITFGALGANLTDLVDTLIREVFAVWVREQLLRIGASDWAVGLVCDGVIGGVGAVLSFFPQILLLFFFLSILEDSGYMSRAAFLMDRALHSIGLSGKAFVPMLMGFGCSVPAIMATRTLEHEKDRRITMLLIPFMSCSAKMPVYSMFVSAFFPSHRGFVVASLYLLGMLVAVAAAFILQKTVLKGDRAPFVMELPPYRMPTVKTLGLHLYDKIKDFMTKAGTVLLGAGVVTWFCQYFDFSLQHVDHSADSILGTVGTAIAPVFAPLGFGDWKSSVAMLSGLIARESIVSTMGILYGAEDAGALSEAILSAYSPASAYAFMVFSLLFIPCMAAMATLRREMNARGWTAAALGLQAVTAWVVTFIVYHICKVIL